MLDYGSRSGTFSTIEGGTFTANYNPSNLTLVVGGPVSTATPTTPPTATSTPPTPPRTRRLPLRLIPAPTRPNQHQRHPDQYAHEYIYPHAHPYSHSDVD